MTVSRPANAKMSSVDVSNMFQVLLMMAVPAVILLTCRFLNLREERNSMTPGPAGSGAASDPADRTGHGAF